MDDTRFDAWTRRRFGLAAGGLAATVLGLAGIEDAQTRKKRKKRCKRLGASCKSGGKRTCCGTLRCDRISFEPSPETRCCRKKDQPCAGNHDCCAGPRAQDFAALFGVGEDDRHIHPLDAQGVALAAIQGLVARLEATREENARLAARVARLETATWSSLLTNCPPVPARHRH
jgi:hypothetical protein